MTLDNYLPSPKREREREREREKERERVQIPTLAKLTLWSVKIMV